MIFMSRQARVFTSDAKARAYHDVSNKFDGVKINLGLVAQEILWGMRGM